MKAKKIKRLRAKCDWYDVEVIGGGVGVFNPSWSMFTQVIAKSPREACLRARRRGYGLFAPIRDEVLPEYANWRVKLSRDIDCPQNVQYF